MANTHYRCGAADIEAFYDDVLKRADLNTAYLRIMGLKRFFAGVRTVLPIFTSPFESMSEKLTHKLGRSDGSGGPRRR